MGEIVEKYVKYVNDEFISNVLENKHKSLEEDYRGIEETNKTNIIDVYCKAVEKKCNLFKFDSEVEKIANMICMTLYEENKLPFLLIPEDIRTTLSNIEKKQVWDFLYAFHETQNDYVYNENISITEFIYYINEIYGQEFLKQDEKSKKRYMDIICYALAIEHRCAVFPIEARICLYKISEIVIQKTDIVHKIMCGYDLLDEEKDINHELIKNEFAFEQIMRQYNKWRIEDGQEDLYNKILDIALSEMIVKQAGILYEDSYNVKKSYISFIKDILRDNLFESNSVSECYDESKGNSKEAKKFIKNQVDSFRKHISNSYPFIDRAHKYYTLSRKEEKNKYDSFMKPVTDTKENMFKIIYLLSLRRNYTRKPYFDIWQKKREEMIYKFFGLDGYELSVCYSAYVKIIVNKEVNFGKNPRKRLKNTIPKLYIFHNALLKYLEQNSKERWYDYTFSLVSNWDFIQSAIYYYDRNINGKIQDSDVLLYSCDTVLDAYIEYCDFLSSLELPKTAQFLLENSDFFKAYIINDDWKDKLITHLETYQGGIISFFLNKYKKDEHASNKLEKIKAEYTYEPLEFELSHEEFLDGLQIIFGKPQ